MSVYRNEWPLLVLSPSSARYHWENEFQNWLGADSQINALEYFNEVDAATDGMLTNDQIHVLTSSKDTIIPSAETKVVICSYGLVPALVQSRRIQPGSFRCAIVDESHMLVRSLLFVWYCLPNIPVITNSYFLCASHRKTKALNELQC
jgi:hypothetical protein